LELGPVAQGEKAVRKSFRNPQLAPILRTELNAEPLSKGDAGASDVYGYVENGAPSHPDQFLLHSGWQLVVETPKHTLVGRGVVVLDEADLPTHPGIEDLLVI